MDTIYKFPIEIVDRQEVMIPGGFHPLHAGLDPTGTPCIWCLVDSDRSKRSFKVFVVGTGNPMPAQVVKHVGSFVQGPFVWHVFIQ